MGRKRSTVYRTLITPTVVSTGSVVNMPSNNYTTRTIYYFGNLKMDYDISTCAKFILYTPDGYFQTDDLAGGMHYNYYVRDHLGNVCAVWDSDISSFAQKTFYYPSGVPMFISSNQSFQPNKYNGKPYEEMHGYDEYEYEFRNYYATIMRFTSMDPLCEQTPWQSPYVYAANNPVCNVDWMGLSPWGFSSGSYGTYSCIIIKPDGTWKGSINDGDDSIYLDEEGAWHYGKSKDGLKKVGRFLPRMSYYDYLNWLDEQYGQGCVNPKVPGVYFGLYSFSINLNLGVSGSYLVFGLNVMSFKLLGISFCREEDDWDVDLLYIGENNRATITQGASLASLINIGQSFDIYTPSAYLAGNEQTVVPLNRIIYDDESGVVYFSFSIGLFATIDVTITSNIYYQGNRLNE